MTHRGWKIVRRLLVDAVLLLVVQVVLRAFGGDERFISAAFLRRAPGLGAP